MAASYTRWPQRQQRPFLDLGGQRRASVSMSIFIPGQRLLIRTSDSKMAPNKQPCESGYLKASRRTRKGNRKRTEQEVWSPSEPGCTIRRESRAKFPNAFKVSLCLKNDEVTLASFDVIGLLHGAACCCCVVCPSRPILSPFHTGGVNSIQPFFPSLTEKRPQV